MRDMRELVQRLADEGITILLSSHLLDEVEELCNRVAIIRRAAIIYEGALGELLATAAAASGSARPTRSGRARLPAQAGSTASRDDGELRFAATRRRSRR